MIDPGHDFGKNTRQSLEVTRRLPEMVASGWPVLVSLSNKDFVGEALDRPVGERLTGTLATTAVSAWLGAGYLPVRRGRRDAGRTGHGGRDQRHPRASRQYPRTGLISSPVGSVAEIRSQRSV